MAKKSRKKSSSSKSKVSFIDKVFSLKKIFVYSIVITFVLFAYKSSIVSSGSVEGLSTTSTFKYKIKMTLFADNKSTNVNRDSNEKCLAKTFKVRIKDEKGKKKEVTVTGNSDCNKFASPLISVEGNCNKIEYENNSLANWTITGIKYSDSNHNGKRSYGNYPITVCVYAPNEGLSVPYYAIVNVGVKSK
jgi:hypothetical protein